MVEYQIEVITFDLVSIWVVKINIVCLFLFILAEIVGLNKSFAINKIIQQIIKHIYLGCSHQKHNKSNFFKSL